MLRDTLDQVSGTERINIRLNYDFTEESLRLWERPSSQQLGRKPAAYPVWTRGLRHLETRMFKQAKCLILNLYLTRISQWACLLFWFLQLDDWAVSRELKAVKCLAQGHFNTSLWRRGKDLSYVFPTHISHNIHVNQDMLVDIFSQSLKLLNTCFNYC